MIDNICLRTHILKVLIVKNIGLDRLLCGIASTFSVHLCASKTEVCINLASSLNKSKLPA